MVELITKIQNNNTLNLYDSEITAQDIGAIMEFIGMNPHITELNLTLNNIGDKGTMDIVKSPYSVQLTRLDLEATNTGDAGGKAIAESQYLTNVKSLNLAMNDSIRDAGAKAIAESQTLGNLAYLNLQFTSIGDAGINAIAESQTLTKLIGDNFRSEGELPACIHDQMPDFELVLLGLNQDLPSDDGYESSSEM